MIHKEFLQHLTFTFLVSSLQGGLYFFCGTWLRCNSLEWNSHSASLRLALHPKNCTLHPVQLPDLGLIERRWVVFMWPSDAWKRLKKCFVSLLAILEHDLPPRLIEHHRDRIGQIEAAASGDHGNAYASLLRETLQYSGR